MPTRLTNLMVDEISFVDHGADQQADVVIFKRDTPVIKAMSPPQLQGHLADQHGIEAGGSNPFGAMADMKTRHKDAHASGDYTSGASHTHPDIAKIDPESGAPEEQRAHFAAHGHVPVEDQSPEDMAIDHGRLHIAKQFAQGKAHTHPEETRWGDESYVSKRDYSTDERIAMAKRGEAIPVRDADGNIINGRFPIGDTADLSNAISAAGRGGGPVPGIPAEVKAHIIKRARALGASDRIPEGWSGTSKSWIAKVGRKIAGGRRKRLEAARDVLVEVLDEAKERDDEEPASVGKGGGKMPEDVLAELVADAETPDEVKQAITALQGEAGRVEGLEKRIDAMTAEAAKREGSTDEEDVFKGLDPRAAQLLREEIAKREAADERVAKLEERTELAEFVETAKSLTHLPISAAEFGPVLRRVSKALGSDEDGTKAYAEILRVLKAGDEAIASERILRESGTGASVFGADTAYGKLEALAKSRVETIRKADGSTLTFEQAFTEVVGDPANRELVIQYDDERKGANR